MRAYLVESDIDVTFIPDNSFIYEKDTKKGYIKRKDTESEPTTIVVDTQTSVEYKEEKKIKTTAFLNQEISLMKFNIDISTKTEFFDDIYKDAGTVPYGWNDSMLVGRTILSDGTVLVGQIYHANSNWMYALGIISISPDDTVSRFGTSSPWKDKRQTNAFGSLILSDDRFYAITAPQRSYTGSYSDHYGSYFSVYRQSDKTLIKSLTLNGDYQGSYGTMNNGLLLLSTSYQTGRYHMTSYNVSETDVIKEQTFFAPNQDLAVSFGARTAISDDTETIIIVDPAERLVVDGPYNGAIHGFNRDGSIKFKILGNGNGFGNKLSIFNNKLIFSLYNSTTKKYMFQVYDLDGNFIEEIDFGLNVDKIYVGDEYFILDESIYLGETDRATYDFTHKFHIFDINFNEINTVDVDIDVPDEFVGYKIRRNRISNIYPLNDSITVETTTDISTHRKIYQTIRFKL